MWQFSEKLREEGGGRSGRRGGGRELRANVTLAFKSGHRRRQERAAQTRELMKMGRKEAVNEEPKREYKPKERDKSVNTPPPKLDFKGHKEGKTANYRVVKNGCEGRRESNQVTQSTCHQLDKDAIENVK